MGTRIVRARVVIGVAVTGVAVRQCGGHARRETFRVGIDDRAP